MFVHVERVFYINALFHPCFLFKHQTCQTAKQLMTDTNAILSVAVNKCNISIIIKTKFISNTCVLLFCSRYDLRKYYYSLGFARAFQRLKNAQFCIELHVESHKRTGAKRAFGWNFRRLLIVYLSI